MDSNREFEHVAHGKNQRAEQVLASLIGLLKKHELYKHATAIAAVIAVLVTATFMLLLMNQANQVPPLQGDATPPATTWIEWLVMIPSSLFFIVAATAIGKQKEFWKKVLLIFGYIVLVHIFLYASFGTNFSSFKSAYLSDWFALNIQNSFLKSIFDLVNSLIIPVMVIMSGLLLLAADGIFGWCLGHTSYHIAIIAQLKSVKAEAETFIKKFSKALSTKRELNANSIELAQLTDDSWFAHYSSSAIINAINLKINQLEALLSSTTINQMANNAERAAAAARKQKIEQSLTTTKAVKAWIQSSNHTTTADTTVDTPQSSNSIH